MKILFYIHFRHHCLCSCCRRAIFTLMSWLSNEPTNVGSLLFATNYWTYVLMHGWTRIFVTRLFGDLFRLFQSCPCNYQTNGARVRATGIVGILTHPLNHADTFCQTLFVWHFFVYLPYYLWWIVHVHTERSDVTMVSCRKMFCEIICQVFKPWCPYYTVCVQIYLIDQPKILSVHRSRLLSFDCAVANSARCVIVHKDRGWDLLPTHFFQGEA